MSRRHHRTLFPALTSTAALALPVDPLAVYVTPHCTYAVSLGKTPGGMATVTYSNLKASLGSLIIGSLAATAYVPLVF